jgi:hypothetical protein
VRQSPWAALVGAACGFAPARAPAAQTTGTLDVGVTTVRYDGFLASGAAAVTPAVRWDGPQGWLSARATYLRFESGHRSMQGLVTGSLFTPVAPRWRGQFAITTGGSRYIDFASFWHAVGEARLHLLSGDRGAWVGGMGGRTSYGRAPRPVSGAALGLWTQRRGVTIFASANRLFIGDTAYTDLESSARTRRGPLTLEAALGARVWSRGGGHGVYGEASATYALGGRTAIVLSGGRYPTDAISGSIAGRYLTVGIRLQTAPRRPVVARDPPPYSPHGGSNGHSAAAPALRVERAAPDSVRLVVHAPLAETVEIVGDFTDWQPVALQRGAGESWEVVLMLSNGLHRIDVRIDGGAWLVPAGTTPVADDFDGAIGIFVVP